MQELFSFCELRGRKASSVTNYVLSGVIFSPLSLFSVLALFSVLHSVVPLPHPIRHKTNNYFMNSYRHIWLGIMHENTDYGSLLSMLTVMKC